MVAAEHEDGRVVVLVEHVDRDGRLGDVGHVGGLDAQRVLLLFLVIQRLGQCDFAAEPVDAEHAVRIAAIRKVVRQRRVGVDVVGRDGGDDRADFRAYSARTGS